jgi:hypothetical protein
MGDSVRPAIGSTFVMRIIAYRNNNFADVLRKRKHGIPPKTFWALESLRADKRIDMILVFRILKEGEHGDLTVVWKELRRQKAPELKFRDGVTVGDLR